jgi:hypothetical protein
MYLPPAGRAFFRRTAHAAESPRTGSSAKGWDETGGPRPGWPGQREPAFLTVDLAVTGMPRQSLVQLFRASSAQRCENRVYCCNDCNRQS